MGFFSRAFDDLDPPQFQQAQVQTEADPLAGTRLIGDRAGLFGATRFVPTAGGGFEQVQSLSPDLQATAGAVTGAGRSLAGGLPTEAFSLSNVPQGIDVASNFFNQQLELLAPQFEQFNVRAKERGLPIGSEAEAFAFNPLRFSVQDALRNAVALTPQEEQRQINNALLERSTQFGDVGRSLTLAQALQGFAPGFVNPAQASLSSLTAGNQASLAATGQLNRSLQQQFQNERQIQQDALAPISSIAGALPLLAFAPQTSIAGGLLGFGGGGTGGGGGSNFFATQAFQNFVPRS